jgi:hypothetical protein
MDPTGSLHRRSRVLNCLPVASIGRVLDTNSSTGRTHIKLSRRTLVSGRRHTDYESQFSPTGSLHSIFEVSPSLPVAFSR